MLCVRISKSAVILLFFPTSLFSPPLHLYISLWASLKSTHNAVRISKSAVIILFLFSSSLSPPPSLHSLPPSSHPSLPSPPPRDRVSLIWGYVSLHLSLIWCWSPSMTAIWGSGLWWGCWRLSTDSLTETTSDQRCDHRMAVWAVRYRGLSGQMCTGHVLVLVVPPLSCEVTHWTQMGVRMCCGWSTYVRTYGCMDVRDV